MSARESYELDRVPTKRDWALPLLIALISLIISGYNGYTNDSKRNAERITTVEVQQTNDRATLVRLENKINQVNDKLDQMLDRDRRPIVVTPPPGWSYREPAKK